MPDPGLPGGIPQRKGKGLIGWSWDNLRGKTDALKAIQLIKQHPRDSIFCYTTSSSFCAVAPRGLDFSFFTSTLLSFQPTHYQIPSLYCSYETNSSPYLLLQPARKEVIHLRPFVALYHDFVSDAEAQKIRELAEPWVSILKYPLSSHMPGEQIAGMARLFLRPGVQNANRSVRPVSSGANHDCSRF